MTLRALGGNPGGGQVPLVRVETCSPGLHSPRVAIVLPRWRLCDVMCLCPSLVVWTMCHGTKCECENVYVFMCKNRGCEQCVNVHV